MKWLNVLAGSIGFVCMVSSGLMCAEKVASSPVCVADSAIIKSDYIRVPMAINDSLGAAYRWAHKPVIASKLLDDMENPTTWEQVGEAKLSFTEERFKDGKQSLRMRAPTIIPLLEGWSIGRPFQYAIAQRNFNFEDWSDYNRISFWVYPNLPGFRVICMEYGLRNDTTVDPDGAKVQRENYHYQLLKNHEWNHVTWEIAHIKRDKITQLKLTYRLQGHELGACDTVSFDFDQLMLEKVEPDYYEGWNVWPGRIAYSNTGYATMSQKTAVASNLAASTFDVINAATKKVVFSLPVKTTKSAIGQNQVLDFSELRTPGTYILKCGSVQTQPFPVNDNIWRNLIWKNINFFFCERCGFDLPGIHSACHRDWQVIHNDKRIVMNGGWHDAGDLSQGTSNTAEATMAFFTLAQTFKTTDPTLSARLIEEGKWGLDWLLKTRFADGARPGWSTMDFWSDGIIDDDVDKLRKGTDSAAVLARKKWVVDDVRVDARSGFQTNIHPAHAEAMGALALASTDEQLSYYALNAAKADFDNSTKNNGYSTVDAGAVVLAAMSLYKATGKQEYADKACTLAKNITASQEKTIINTSIPLFGYFYSDQNKKKILHYFHWTSERMVLPPLAELCAAFPDHPDWMEWYSAIVLHSEYLKAASRYSDPYCMLPAGVYNIDEQNDPLYKKQVSQGVPLGGNLYLRIFPVWPQNRGNSGVLMAQTKNLSVAAHARNNSELIDLCQKQLEWLVGRNPFAQSEIYGEGHDFQPLFVNFIGNVAGAISIGIYTDHEKDVPCWSATNVYNQKEVWGHVNSQWMLAVNDLEGPACVKGTLPHGVKEVSFFNTFTGRTEKTAAKASSNEFTAWLSAGTYTIRAHGFKRQQEILPGGNYTLNLANAFDYTCITDMQKGGKVAVTLSAKGSGPVTFALRSSNLTFEQKTLPATLSTGKEVKLTTVGTVVNSNEPWVVVVVPNGDMGMKKDVFGYLPR